MVRSGAHWAHTASCTPPSGFTPAFLEQDYCTNLASEPGQDFEFRWLKSVPKGILLGTNPPFPQYHPRGGPVQIQTRSNRLQRLFVCFFVVIKPGKLYPASGVGRSDISFAPTVGETPKGRPNFRKKRRFLCGKWGKNYWAVGQTYDVKDVY